MSPSDSAFIDTPISLENSHSGLSAADSLSTSGSDFHFVADNILASAGELLSLAGASGTAHLDPIETIISAGLSTNPLLPQSVNDFLSAAGSALSGQQSKVAELATYGTAAADHLAALAAIISASEQTTAHSFEALR